jgi:hypothetical protein
MQKNQLKVHLNQLKLNKKRVYHYFFIHPTLRFVFNQFSLFNFANCKKEYLKDY